MLMSCKPQDQIGIMMKIADQFSIGYTSVWFRASPASGYRTRWWYDTYRVARWCDTYRYMCGDDHKLTFSLALIKFTYKPGQTERIERAISIAGKIGIIFTLCIVQHNNLDRHIRFWLETIRGKIEYADQDYYAGRYTK